MQNKAPIQANSGLELSPARASVPLGATRNQRIASTAFAVALLLLGLWILRGFLPALAWAAILAIATWPLYERAKKHCPSHLRNLLLPVVFTLAIAFTFILPLVLFGVRLSREAQSLFFWFEGMRLNGVAPPDWATHLPFVGPAIGNWWQANLAGPQRTAALLGRLNRGDIFAFSQNVGTHLVRWLVTFTFTLVTLFFLFKEGETLSRSLFFLGNRLFGPRGEQVGRQIVASIHGTVDGLVVVGLGEGLVLGIAYYIVGVPHATLLGAATAIAAIIPFGAPLLFSIAAIMLLYQGSTIAAVVIFAFGMAVVGVADHLIRPVIIGGATRLPFLWVLLGILGGVETWGLLGLFLGPAVMAVLILLWREWTSSKGEAEFY
jgi:predicted PurR-regulated permease PerM